MAQGPIDHPSYLTRQRFDLGNFTAGANALGQVKSPGFAIRPHVPVVAIQTAGTATANAANIICVGTYTLTTSGTSTTTSGTNTLQSVTLSTAAANTVVVGSDMNVTLNANAVVYIKNGADTVSVYTTQFDYTLDPVLGTWTGV